MDFSNVVFHKSIGLGSKEVFFENKKEIVFVGRSNVGKSSILNALFNKKDLVKTSARPGKTKLANLFLIHNKYYFTDLPGYGFAKLGKQLKEELDGLISWYIEERKEYIKKVVILIDSKVGPLKSDLDMYEFLLTLEIGVVFVLSKIDRIPNSETKRVLAMLQKTFFGQDIFCVSSLKKTGIKDLEKYLKNTLIS